MLTETVLQKYTIIRQEKFAFILLPVQHDISVGNNNIINCFDLNHKRRLHFAQLKIKIKHKVYASLVEQHKSTF